MKRVMLSPTIWVDAEQVRAIEIIDDYGDDQICLRAHVGGDRGWVGVRLESRAQLVAKLNALGFHEAADINARPRP